MPARRQLSILINMATADGEVAEKEQKLILSIGKAGGLTEEEINKMIGERIPVGDLTTLTADDKFEYLYSVVQLMKMDGKVFKSEIAYCEDLALKLGYKKGVVGELSKRIYSDPTITSDRMLLRRQADKYLK